jgi:hypothetical protein
MKAPLVAIIMVLATGAEAATLQSVQGQSDEVSFSIIDEFDFASRIVFNGPEIECSVHLRPADLVAVRSDAKRGQASTAAASGECIGVGELVPLPEIEVTCRFDRAHWQRSTGRTVTLENGRRQTLTGSATFASANCQVTIDGEGYEVLDSWIRRDVEQLRLQ